MAKHKRRAPLFVRRSAYLKLLREYQELEHHYRVLAGDRDELAGATAPLPRHVPSWAETEPVPVITSAGLDTAKADALLRRWGMAGSPAGSWNRNAGTSG
jgi:hypothetical protein